MFRKWLFEVNIGIDIAVDIDADVHIDIDITMRYSKWTSNKVLIQNRQIQLRINMKSSSLNQTQHQLEVKPTTCKVRNLLEIE